MFTDGVTDALNPTGKAFSEEYLFSMVCQPALSFNDSLEKIKIALVEHIAVREQFDDITLMAIKREPESSKLISKKNQSLYEAGPNSIIGPVFYILRTSQSDMMQLPGVALRS